MLEVKNISKQFSNIKVVNNVSFTCPNGCITGLLGPNGAGKTTTLRIIGGLLKPSSGTVRIDGYDNRTNNLKALSLLGVLGEGAGLYPRLSPREHLRYFGLLYGLEKNLLEVKINQLINLLNMGDFADKKAGTLSKGMSQKVALARALIHEPANLIMDEPTSGLDVLSQRAIQEIILKLKEQKKAVLLSTHLMSEAERLCDQVYLIHRGSIIAFGSPAALKGKTDTTNLEEAFLSLVNKGQASSQLSGSRTGVDNTRRSSG